MSHHPSVTVWSNQPREDYQHEDHSRDLTWLVICADRRHAGPYTLTGALLAEVVPTVLASDPGLVTRHEIEILTAAADMRKTVPAIKQTLTSLAIPEEHTRFYSPLRLVRVAHGLADFLLNAVDLGHIPPIALDIRHVDTADRTDLDVLAVLARRMPWTHLRLRLHSESGDLPEPLETSQGLRRVSLRSVGRDVEYPASTPPADGVDSDLSTAARYVAHECHCADDAARSAYEHLDRAAQARLHDERAAQLVSTGAAAAQYGALNFHLERGTDPEAAVRTLLGTLQYCLNMGFYDSAIDVGMRLRSRISWESHPLEMGKTIGPLTMSLMMLGITHPVLSMFDEVLEHTTDPGLHSLVYYGTAMVHTRYSADFEKDHRAARRWLNNAIAISQLWPEKEFRSFVTAFNKNGLALVELHVGDLPAALGLVDEGLQLLAEGVPVGRQELHRSVLRHNRAQVLDAMGRRDEALIDFTAVIEADPRHSEYYLDRGNLLRRMGRAHQALADYERAISCSPPYIEPVLNLANTLLELGDLGQAFRGYERVLELEPGNVDAHLNRTSVLLQTEDLEAAEVSALALLAVSDSAEAHCLAGQVALARGQFAAGLEHFDIALTMDDSMAACWSGRGSAHLELGQAGEAVNDLTQALDRVNDPVLWFNRGVANRAAGRLGEAVADFSRAAQGWTDQENGYVTEALSLRDDCVAAIELSQHSSWDVA